MNYLKRKMSPLHWGRSRRAEWRDQDQRPAVTVYRGTEARLYCLLTTVLRWRQKLTPPLHHRPVTYGVCPIHWSMAGKSTTHTETTLGAPNLTADLSKPLLMEIPGKRLTPLSLLISVTRVCPGQLVGRRSQPRHTLLSASPEHFHLVQHVRHTPRRAKGTSFA